MRKIVSAVIKHGDKFLIGKRADDKKFAPGKWEFISGFIEQNEDPEQTIKREINEEIGGQAKTIRRLPDYEVSDSDGLWRITPFLVELANPDRAKRTLDHSEIKWLTWDELNKIEHLSNDLKKLGKL